MKADGSSMRVESLRALAECDKDEREAILTGFVKGILLDQ